MSQMKLTGSSAPKAALVSAELPGEPPRQTLAIVAVVSGSAAIAIGLLALIGWSFGLPALTQFFATRSAMQPITAICSVLAGAGILSTRAGTADRIVPISLSLLVVLASVQTLVEYILAIDLGTDHLFFGEGVGS